MHHTQTSWHSSHQERQHHNDCETPHCSSSSSSRIDGGSNGFAPAWSHHGPPSVANTGLALDPSSSSSNSYVTRQKRSRPRRRPRLESSTSSSPTFSWQPTRSESDPTTAHADDDDDSDNSADGDDDPDDPAQHGYSILPRGPPASSPQRPPKKRLHLDQEDVGRFAGMSIFEGRGGAGEEATQHAPIPSLLQPTTRPRGRTLHRAPKHPPVQSQPRAPPVSPAPTDRQGVGGAASFLSMSALTPSRASPDAWGADDDNDTQMGTARPPSSWDLDRHTTYVHSLDDDEEEGEGDGDASTNLTSTSTSTPDKATIPITRQEAEQLQRHRDAKTAQPSTSASPASSPPPSAYEINPELLAKLEAHSRSVLIGGDMSRRRRPPSAPSPDQAKNALVLWKGPEQLFAASSSSGQTSPAAGGEQPNNAHGYEAAAPSSLPSSAAGTPPPQPPGIFAFGTPQNSQSSPSSSSFSPSFAPQQRGPSQRNVSGASTSSTMSTVSSISATPVGSPKFSFARGNEGGSGGGGMEIDG